MRSPVRLLPLPWWRAMTLKRLEAKATWSQNDITGCGQDGVRSQQVLSDEDGFCQGWCREPPIPRSVDLSSLKLLLPLVIK